jgi:selenocysteine lyase/cysteine desulfurase
MRVLHNIGESKRLNIITLAFDKENFAYDLEKVGYKFAGEKPSLVVVSHASNVCGVVAPIAEIAAAAKKYGAVNVIDMCQTMGLIDTDLSSDAIDFAVFAGHKTLYAPFGASGFICNADSDLKPLIYGGTGIDSASRTLPATIPERYEVGSQNVVAIAGLNAALKWANGSGIENIFNAEQRNRTRLIEVLNVFDNIRIVSPISCENAVGVVSCVFDGFSSDSIGQILSERGVAVRTGLHCAPDAHRFLGTFPSGTVRFSVSYFNTDEDFAQLEEALDYIRENS